MRVAAGRLTLVTALVVLGIGTSLASFAVGYRLLPAGWRPRLLSRRVLSREGLQQFRFGRWIWIGSMFAVLVAQLDVLLVNHWYGAATVGAYGLALNLATKLDVVNHSLYTVLIPTASALEGRGNFGSYVRRSLLRSALVSVGLLALIPLAEPFILTFYGPAYAPAVDLFQLMVGVVIFDTMAIPLLLLAFPLNRPRLLAAADALRLITLVAAAVWLLPTYGPAGAVVAKFLAKVAGAVLILAVLVRR